MDEHAQKCTDRAQEDEEAVGGVGVQRIKEGGGLYVCVCMHKTTKVVMVMRWKREQAFFVFLFLIDRKCFQ